MARRLDMGENVDTAIQRIIGTHQVKYEPELPICTTSLHYAHDRLFALSHARAAHDDIVEASVQDHSPHFNQITAVYLVGNGILH
ncbi:hypothetical protein P153DRAFT_383095 [Dothidotthia symphoricarpi CBS 119687]|uniref:Uncharacterized protein n=1 Tax=Dothidotthia symphoricarpi CBS 119687 TaxID=1392245 RepID=A0A6A6AMU4_9PLEO|nr:uncharacterized protein P153DRAFT_383095 [Dothidotthia symphoricarpi CBS 119687]KAF2132207.1 hypothetical protein P153DRAFT_383095 [Dothidotthia symphoricarpi CBS 119687]